MPKGLEKLLFDQEDLQKSIQTGQIKDIQIIQDQQTQLDPSLLKYTISGPIDSPYEGYWFRIEMKFTSDYPFRPPQVNMIDQVWNPFFDFDKGDICIDILNQEWTPAYTPTKILISVISVLSQTKIDLEGSGFLNPKAASEMKNNFFHFSQEVKKHSNKHSFKRQQIYNDTERTVPQQHVIIAQGSELINRIREDIKDEKIKKKKGIKKSENIVRRRRRVGRRIRRHCGLP